MSAAVRERGAPRAVSRAGPLRWRTLYPRPGAEWSAVLEDHRGRRHYGLYDPVRRRVRPVLPHEDPELLGLPGALVGGDLVSYRVGRRATVRSRDGRGYVKVLPPRKTPRVLALARAAAALRDAPGAPRLPRLLSADLEQGTLAFAVVPGTPLRTRLHGDGAGLAIRDAARAVAAFHCAPVPAELPPGREELEPREWVSLVQAVAPRLVPRYAAALATLPPRPQPAPRAPAHGDLHDGNVLIGAAVALIDLDSLHAGDAAEDVGNLAAHLVLRAMQRGAPPEEGWAQARAFVASYRAAGGSAAPSEVSAFASRTLFRLAALYVFRRPWRVLAPALLDQAGRTIDLAR